MNKINVKSVIAIVAITAALGACKPKQDDDLKNVKLESTEQKFSYGMGLQIGKMAKTQGIELDLAAYKAGLLDGTYGNEQRLSDEDLQAAFTDYQQKVSKKKELELEVEAAKNAKVGEAFLVTNAKKEGVKTTASGLQYKAITEGTGSKPTAEDTVKVHYKGTLIDGTEFDSSYKRNQPIEFPLKGVIKGWQEGLQLMSKGSKYELYVPAALAYGENGAGKIGPNAVLIFEVELLDINPKAEEAAIAQEAAAVADVEAVAAKAAAEVAEDAAKKAAPETTQDATKKAQ